MATENVEAWSKTAATNSAADAGINWAEGQDPASVNNSARGMMAALAKQSDDQGGGLAAGGTANALTVTTNQVLASGQITDGLRVMLKATADNTSATVTFAPDGLTAANIKRADGSALAVGSIKNGMYLDLVYNSGSSEWRAANIAPATGGGSGGLVFLTSGTVAAATLDIVLTSYTAYRGIKIFLSGFLPATNGVALWARFSTDGGSNYATSGYNWTLSQCNDSGTPSSGGSGSDAKIVIQTTIGNSATQGYDGEITILNQTASTFWTKLFHIGFSIDSSANPLSANGGGAKETAQDTDAIRFLFSSGNISAGNYAVYGLA